MTTLLASQHLYANVEADVSPNRRGGFQTLVSTDGISAREVAQIEGRLSYVDAESHERKRFFFVTETGKPVAGQIVPVTERDGLGRGGRYIAHSLVLEPTEFEKVGNDPIAVLRAFRFIETMPDAVGLLKGNATRVLFDVEPVEGVKAELDMWRRDELTALVEGCVRHGVVRGREMTILGSADEVEQLISLVLRAVPVALRPRCSFDTYLHRGNPVGKNYWAVGQPRTGAVHVGTVVDATNRRVLNMALPERTSPPALYERWLVNDLSSRRDVAFTPEAQAADALCDWVEGEQVPPPRVPRTMVEIFAKEFPGEFSDRLVQAMRSVVGGALTSRLLGGPALDRLDMYALLQDPDPPHAVAPLLWSAYREAKRAVSPGIVERQEIEIFAKRAGDDRFRLLAACLRRDDAGFTRALATLSDPDYRSAVEWFTRTDLARPFRLVLPQRAAAMLESAFIDPQRADVYVPDLVEAILRTGQDKALRLATKYLPHLSRKQFDRVDELTAGLTQKHVFRAAVLQDGRRREEEGGFWNFPRRRAR